MVNRINLLLQAKNITARQFAEEIGIQPSGMSHILSGRNNPSLDFVMKVIRRWPEVNINWLMFGKGEMFSGVPQAPVSEVYPAAVQRKPDPVQAVTSMPDGLDSSPVMQVEADLFSQPEAPHAVVDELPEPVTPVEDVPAPKTPPMAQRDENRADVPVRPSVPVQPNLPHKRAVKIIVLYDDHTFSEYRPA